MDAYNDYLDFVDAIDTAKSRVWDHAMRAGNVVEYRRWIDGYLKLVELRERY